MRRTTLYRTLPIALLGTAGTLQVAPSLSIAHAAASAATARTFKGPTEETQHGPVGVSIVVKKGKIVDVKTKIAPLQDGRSPFLQGRAVPILRSEVLKAQSTRIDTVSGATETSEAFIQSLQSAIKSARKARALK